MCMEVVITQFYSLKKGGWKEFGCTEKYFCSHFAGRDVDGTGSVFYKGRGYLLSLHLYLFLNVIIFLISSAMVASFYSLKGTFDSVVHMASME